MKNRSLLALSYVLLLPACGSDLGPDPGPVTKKLQVPDVYTSENGLLHLRVEAVDQTSTINDTEYKRMRVYKTEVVGGQGTYRKGDTSAYIAPEWHLKPGDRLIIDYINSLLPYDFSPLGGHHGDPPPQPLNLHTHGLTVSPSGNSDNVLLSVPPQRSNRYVVDIPNHHHHGLFWYHPHIHGLADEQVYSGLAGHIVIGRADGDYQEFGGLTIRTMMIRYNVQQPGQNGELLDASANDSHGTSLVGDGGRMVYTINGRVSPSIQLNAATAESPAESQIWAFTNATGSGSYILALEEIDRADALDARKPGKPLPLVAVSIDGSPMPAPLTLPGGRYHIPQGGRIAFLVEGPSSVEKVVRLIQVQNRSGSGDQSARNAAENKGIAGWRDYTQDVLAVSSHDPSIVARHVSTPESLTPSYVPVPLDLLGPNPDYTRTLTFDDVVSPNEFPVNGALFPYNRVDQPRADTLEEWTVLNQSSLTHPFHFHTQYGQVKEIVAPLPSPADPGVVPTESKTGTLYQTIQQVVDMTQPKNPQYTQDVVALPPALVGPDGNLHPTTPEPGKLVMRLRFLPFLGTYVEHCHRLPHEDRGMMSLVRTIVKTPVLAIAAQHPGADSTVEILHAVTEQKLATLTPFAGFQGKLSLSLGDVDGDAKSDVIVASGAGRRTTVAVYFAASNYAGEPSMLFPFDQDENGATVAAGDINGDLLDDIIVGEGPGGLSRVLVRSVKEDANIVAPFRPYGDAFAGGVSVAAGMVEAGGRLAFFTTPGAGHLPVVKMFNVDLFGDANGQFPDPATPLAPIHVLSFQTSQQSPSGSSILSAYPFAKRGGFASVLAAPLAGETTMSAYTIAPMGDMHDVSTTGVHKASVYDPAAPRQETLVIAHDIGAAAVLGAYSTEDGAVIVSVSADGGPVKRWRVDNSGGSVTFTAGKELAGVTGHFVAGM